MSTATTDWWGQRKGPEARTAGRAVAGVVVGLCVMAGAGPAGAAPPDPDATIELAPGYGADEPIVISDDAVYYTVFGDHLRSAVYTRPLTRDASGTEVGPATLIGRTTWDGQLALHEGTLAYTRSVDDRLVLRAPDGTETFPEWGHDPDLAGGVVTLTAEWVLAIDYPYEATHTLYDRQTGAKYDLTDLVTVPAPFTWKGGSDVTITDDRAMFGIYSEALVGGVETAFSGLYTVALGADGPTGAVTTLAESTHEMFAGPYTYYSVVGIDGTRIVWTETTCVASDCDQTLLWRDAAPYDGTPSEAPMAETHSAFLDGSTLVTVHDEGYPTTSVAWWSLDDLSTPLRTLELPNPVAAVHDDLVVHTDFQAEVSHLTDVDGDPVTSSGGPVADPFPFRDVPLGYGDPFADEIMWLYDRGVVGGYADGTFRHLAPVNRDAMAAFLFRMALPGVDTTDCPAAVFADVPAAHPFCAEISWLSETGITTGFDDDTFRPATPVTREAMAAFLYRLANDDADAPGCTEPPFTDVGVGNPFCGEIAWLASTGVTTGWPDGTFRPSTSIERQAMAAFLFRYMEAGLVPPPIP